MFQNVPTMLACFDGTTMTQTCVSKHKEQWSTTSPIAMLCACLAKGGMHDTLWSGKKHAMSTPKKLLVRICICWAAPNLFVFCIIVAFVEVKGGLQAKGLLLDDVLFNNACIHTNGS